MRILFVIPPSVGDYFTAQIPHTGLAYLTAFMKKETNAQIQIMDMRLGYSMVEVFRRIDSFMPDIVGLSLFSYGFGESREVVDSIKSYKDYYRVVVGGPHVAAVGIKVLEDTKADFAVCGEGELTFLELCRAVAKKRKNFSNIDGLIWRNGRKILANKKRELIRNLDKLPYPDYESFELEKYLCYTEKHLPIVTSRGCPYSCVYCSVRLSMGQMFRPRSAENVSGEIKYWYDKGWKSFDFADDVFNADMDRAKKICDQIAELKITWRINNGIRADRIDMELLEKMKKSGCVYIAYGVESASNRILAAMKKNITIEQIESSVYMARKVGITVGITFIIGSPDETFEDFMKSYMFAKSMPVQNVNFYNMVPYPNTEMYHWVEKNGKFLKDKESYLYKIAHWKNEPIFETPYFTGSERKKAFRMGFGLHRKKLIELKFGRIMGSFIWVIARNEKLDGFLRRSIMKPGLGRKIFNVIKRE
jgi:radical SAM superfamily enzyme YgiQ (UPF0313 family)